MYAHARTTSLAAGILLLAATLPAEGAFKDIPPSKDNTLYESGTGALSNGAGEYIFMGRTDKGFIRRTAIAFAVADSIPAGSTIDSVVLNLFLSRSKLNTSKNTTVYRILNDWGEARSNAAQNEGEGAPADTGDATWLHRFRYPDVLWSAPGGDFDPTARATTGVASNNFYRWSSALMTADAQSWFNSPATNFGWLIRGVETANTTATRFNSRQNTDTTRRPYLRVYYTPTGGDPTGACCLPISTCVVVTQTQCLAQGGTYQGDNSPCSPDPCGGTQTTVTVGPAQDNTLYEDAAGSLSNGAGTRFLASKGPTGLLRRGVLKFNLVPSIPTGAAVTNATLTMYNSQVGTNSATVTVHKTTADWGEGTSAATGDGDAGAPSTTGDATWIHRVYPSTNWTTPGADFIATESATTSVVNDGSYSWTSAALVADVQAWVNNPATNFGWVVRGKETGPGNALKSFESRESADPTKRPKLEITYLAPAIPTGACCLPDGSCDTLSAADCATAGGTYQGDNTSCAVTFCPVVLAPFVDALPLPAVATPTSGTIGGAASYQIAVTEFKQRLHRDLPLTTVWGYGGSYPGPTIVASVGNMVNVTWVNDLRDWETGTPRTQHYLPVDLCVHGPDMYGPSARIVSHLHGGHVQPESDGYPTQTSLPGQRQTFHYPNNQLPGTLWYHDHALGITRLNVMMGMAGFYLLTDAFEASLGLPSGEFEAGLAIQDRTFNPDGSLQYPATWQDHWFGDKALVNGKVWPYFNVKQGKYRFRLLDGSTSRVYTLKLSNGAPFTQIGTEGGLLTSPVVRDSITITPGERADVIIDFAPFPAGTEIILTNSAPAPFPIGDPMEPALPEIMKFIVQGTPGHTGAIPATLRPVTPLVEEETQVHRDFVLAKTPGPPCAGSIWTINGKMFDDVTEFPVLGSTEVWRYINRSGSVHPMHMHLVMFQILDRQPFVIQADTIALVGSPIPPGPEEAGWKDTAPAYPNQVMRVITKFEDYAGRYVYHCHILEHEENEMMRQFQVVHAPVTAAEVTPPAARFELEPAAPNPFNPVTRISYELRQAAHARIDVFDISGRLVSTLLDAWRPAGPGSVKWDGRTSKGLRAASGVYSYRLTAHGGVLTRKLVVLK